MSRPIILVVDDERPIRRALATCLSKLGFEPVLAATAHAGLESAQSRPIDVALVDVGLPDGDGFDLMRSLREIDPNLPCVIITGRTDVKTAVAAIQAGAFYFVGKPFQVEELAGVLRHAIETRNLRERNRDLEEQLQSRRVLAGFVGQSVPIRRVRALVEQLAATRANVLILGESGTGKELVARSLHELSAWREHRLVPVNCAAIPEHLLESELFGFVKGAFTGATESRQGLVARAHRGTLFLDEIGDMAPALQAKLLRVLQDGEFEPLGSRQALRVDARVVAATHRDLDQAIESGDFRPDLFYRLNVLRIELPPLRDHLEDLPALTDWILRRIAKRQGAEVCGISAEALRALADYAWPGNVRELENTVERLAVLHSGAHIEADDVRQQLAAATKSPCVARVRPQLPVEGIDLRHAVQEFEAELIEQALARCHGNKRAAADLLHINRTTLVEKLKRPPLRSPRDLRPAAPAWQSAG